MTSTLVEVLGSQNQRPVAVIDGNEADAKEEQILTPPQQSRPEFLIIMALLMAMAVLAINVILPAFHDIAREFELVDPNQVGLTVSLLYAGLAVGQVLFGSLSDSIGRKPALAWGLGLFLTGCLISGLARDFSGLVLGQIVQGLGLGAPRIVTLAILRDRFSGDAMARAMSFVMMIFVVVPTVSPYLGQVIVGMGGWRQLFLMLGILGGALVFYLHVRLLETLPKNKRRELSTSSFLTVLKSVLRNRYAMGYAVALGVFTGPFIAYLNMSQQVFEFQYALHGRYPLVFAVLSIWLGLASFVNGIIVRRFGAVRLVTAALMLVIVASAFLFGNIQATGEDPPFVHFAAYMAAVLFCFGLLVSNLNVLAMETLGATAGTGAALVGAISTLISVPFAIAVGSFYSGSVVPVVLGFGVCGFASLLLHLRLGNTISGRNRRTSIEE